ncbi:RluA family pseudouridine synthase [Geothrix sp. PMB-07]|uniref:RluA family pseudouridine synthase n=1 Tax=Geothrix sp. PMB-07 TaxID=3068640 RepID=UPI0027413CA0|nr:RluA family pseudouridine synthase [Geothrix sp. PMB-07]WLT33191.1 RluA family pseudouridine synthase [Geothrix sp. PMB-07]
MPEPNHGASHQDQISLAEAGLTVCAHLATKHPRASTAEWLERIHAGQVFLDDRLAAPMDLLRAGQRLVWNRPPWVEPEAPLATAILYEDTDLLAVAKPSGLPTLPGGGEYQDQTLLALVRRRHPEASPMHRLGRGTSGVVLFAPTAATRKPLQQVFQMAGTRKTYRALCIGQPSADTFEIDAPIGEVPYPPLGVLHAASAQGRPSFSRVTVLERRENAALIDVDIRTGRPHQIRIHLAWAGHPLAGDPLYGPGGTPRPGSTALPGDLGYLLHAHRLELTHPRTGERIILTCQPPPELRLRESGQGIGKAAES